VDKPMPDAEAVVADNQIVWLRDPNLIPEYAYLRTFNVTRTWGECPKIAITFDMSDETYTATVGTDQRLGDCCGEHIYIWCPCNYGRIDFKKAMSRSICETGINGMFDNSIAIAVDHTNKCPHDSPSDTDQPWAVIPMHICSVPLSVELIMTLMAYTDRLFSLPYCSRQENIPFDEEVDGSRAMFGAAALMLRELSSIDVIDKLGEDCEELKTSHEVTSTGNLRFYNVPIVVYGENRYSYYDSNVCSATPTPHIIEGNQCNWVLAYTTANDYYFVDAYKNHMAYLTTMFAANVQN
jgi:hypothetical protein